MSILTILDNVSAELALAQRACGCGCDHGRREVANARMGIVEAVKRIERERVKPTGEFDLSDVEAALSPAVKP